MTIKNIIIAAASSLLVLASCTKTKDLGPEKLTIEGGTSAIELAKEGETVTVTLNATVDWELQGYTADIQSWLSITPASGSASADAQTITIKSLANTGTDRSADIVFYGNVLCKAPLTITQKGDKGDTETLSVDAFIKKADKANEYRLTGTVSGFNSQYCSFDLTDATGKIYVYSVTNKADWADKISNGGTVVLKGKYEYYAAKNQHEVVDAVIESFKEAETPDYEKAEAKSVADFIKAADTNTYYKLTGTVSSFNATYCSFDLTDATGKIYVYSVANKADWAAKIANGGTVTLAGQYFYYENATDASKNKVEIKDAYIIDFKAGETPDYGKAESKTVADFITAANKTTYFKLKGTVSNFNTTNCSFDLTDATGAIYVYSVANSSEWLSKISAGGTVELAGKYDYYETDKKHEVVEAYIISFTAGEAPKITLAHPLTSNVTWTAVNDNKTYDVEVKINGETYKALKFGTTKVIGYATLTVPATATKLSFYATGWKGKAGVIEIVNGETVVKSITAPENNGANNNTPFTYETLTDADNYFTIDISAIKGVTSLTLRSTADACRAILFGVNAE